MGKTTRKRHHLVGVLAGLFLFLAAGSPAFAAPMSYSFSIGLDTGGTLMGFFTGDDDANPMDGLINNMTGDLVSNFEMTCSGCDASLNNVEWKQSEGDTVSLIWDTVTDTLLGLTASDIMDNGGMGTDFMVFIGAASLRLDPSYYASIRTFDGEVLGHRENIPTPETLALFGLGLFGLGFSRRRARAAD